MCKISKLTRYFLRLAYDGLHYHGWQSQENAVSVQTEIEKCMTLKLGEIVKLSGCGRTDTRVHARTYYAHFDLANPIDLEKKDSFLNNLNQFLPADIVLIDLSEVSPEANARFDAISRTYSYYMHHTKDPFIRHHSLYYYGPLDVDTMQEACSVLLEYEDFTSFSKLHTQTKTNNCRISKAVWVQSGHNLVFTITADRFLRNMVRAIVGTMLEIGKGKLTIEGFKEVIESKNRSNAGFSVPGYALFLENVSYPEELFLQKQGKNTN